MNTLASIENDAQGSTLSAFLGVIYGITLVGVLFALSALLCATVVASHRFRTSNRLPLGAAVIWGIGYALASPLRLAMAARNAQGAHRASDPAPTPVLPPAHMPAPQPTHSAA